MPKIENLSESAQILAIPPCLYKQPQAWFQGHSVNPALVVQCIWKASSLTDTLALVQFV